MVEPISVLIPFDSSRAVVAVETARLLAQSVQQVVLAGDRSAPDAPAREEVVIGANVSSVRAGVERLTEDCTVVLEPEVRPTVEDLRALCHPVQVDQADFVVPATAKRADWALNAMARGVAGVEVQTPLSPVRAIRTEALRSISLISQGTAVTAELLVKLAAQCFRFAEVKSSVRYPARSLPAQLALSSILARYALLRNDADNAHEGYNTLLQMDQAPRYNAWLGRKLRPHLGRRVLEIGAGIGTITREIAKDRDLVIALEADPFYVQRLRNIFRRSPVVRPLHAPVESTDWDALGRERLDTVMLSNVLEHIEDDAAAIHRFRSVLSPGGRLVILVPALMSLYGSIDVAIGHFRRYDPASLRAVIESGGFRLEGLEWLNLLGIPGWFLNSRILKRRSVPGVQVRLYDRLAPLLAQAESVFELPVGMSLLAVASAV